MQLDELLHDSLGCEALVTTVLAILEMWRLQNISVLQSEPFGDISLLSKGSEQ